MATPSAQAPRPAHQDAHSVTAKPVATFRCGDVSAAVFTQSVKTKDGRTVALPNVSLRRSYQDGNGNWQHTTTLRRDDLLAAAYALTKCYDFLSQADALAKG